MTAATTGPTARPTVLLVATGRREYREYALDALARRYRVHLVLDTEPTWQRRHVAAHDVVSDAGDVDALLGVARRVAAEHDLRGVLCWEEAQVLPVALVADALGLPSAGAEAAGRCRDKYAQRLALAAADVAQPDFGVAHDVDEALHLARRLGYPVVLKPRSLAAGLGVVRADGDDDVRARFAVSATTTVPGAPQHDAPVVVERYLAGEMVSVDSVVTAGVPHPLVVARKLVGFAPHFEEVGHDVAADDPLLHDPALGSMLRRVHEAIGLRWGFTHTELVLTGATTAVIEVNARMGGDLIGYLAGLVHGLDLTALAAAAACGDAEVAAVPRRPTPARGVAGIRFVYAEYDDLHVRSAVFDEDELVRAGVDRAESLVAPGDVLRLPAMGPWVGRTAYVIARGADGREVSESLHRGTAAFVVNGSPGTTTGTRAAAAPSARALR